MAASNYYTVYFENVEIGTYKGIIVPITFFKHVYEKLKDQYKFQCSNYSGYKAMTRAFLYFKVSHNNDVKKIRELWTTKEKNKTTGVMEYRIHAQYLDQIIPYLIKYMTLRCISLEETPPLSSQTIEELQIMDIRKRAYDRTDELFSDVIPFLYDRVLTDLETGDESPETLLSIKAGIINAINNAKRPRFS
jgi:hypothetical protein